MTVNDLVSRLERLQEVGWGNKKIYIDVGNNTLKLKDIDDVDWTSVDEPVIVFIPSK